MKYFIKYLICILIVYSNLNAQSQQIKDNNSGLNCFPRGLNSYLAGFNTKFTNNISNSFYGSMVHKTPEPGQYLRILILYVKFPDDVLAGDPMNGYAVWSDPNMPAPLNPHTVDHRFIDSAEGIPQINFMDRYTQYTISDYFCEMSRCQFDVIGDEYSVLLPLTSIEYREMGYNMSQINEIAITQAEQQYNLDFTRYNNWSWGFTGWEWNPGGGDNTADMIVMEYRKAPGYPEENWFINVGIPVSGISDLGLFNTLTFDNTMVSSGSGVTCLSVLQNYSKMTQIMLHEISHRYFYNHFEIGLMTGVEHSCFNYSPYERKTLEYIDPVIINYPYTSQSETYTLGDYISTGDMIEINLPSSGEKYYIANHQKRSMYDGISRGGKNCWDINRVQQDPYCPDGKGLYIYQETSSLTICNNLKEVELVQADGKHNWYVDRMVPYFIPGYTFTIPLFEPLAGNFLGKSEFHQRLDTSFQNMQEVNDNPCSDDPDNYFVTYDWLGDGKDAFNMGYSEILSPYSNPRSVLCDGSASGISIKLLDQDSGTGSIRVKIYFDDNLAVQELPPSKPKNLKAAKLIFEPLTGRFHPSLSWDKNSEPDFISNQGHYNIYRGISPTCDPDVEPEFELAGSVSPDSSSFIDETISLYPEGGGLISCFDLYRSVYYKVEAVDVTDLASLKSDASIINGYTEQCDDSIIVGIPGNQLPVKFAIFNYPNPFNPSTNIKYSLPQSSYVTLKIYNLLGQEIYAPLKNEFKAAGYYSVLFDGTNLSSGIYFYHIEARQTGSNTVSYIESRKMVLIK